MFIKQAIEFILDPIKGIIKVTQKDPKVDLWFLSPILGSITLISIFQGLELGQSLKIWQILLLVAVLSPFIGYGLLVVLTWIVRGTGLWIGTRGAFKNIRWAIAFSSIPLIGYLFCKLILIAIFRDDFFLNFPSAFGLYEAFIFYTLVIFQVFFFIWAIILLIQALSEVKHTSMNKAIINLILAVIVLGVVLFIVTLPYTHRCSNFFDFPELTYTGTYEGWQEALF